MAGKMIWESGVEGHASNLVADGELPCEYDLENVNARGQIIGLAPGGVSVLASGPVRGAPTASWPISVGKRCRLHTGIIASGVNRRSERRVQEALGPHSETAGVESGLFHP